jgi:hypothetical protein
MASHRPEVINVGGKQYAWSYENDAYRSADGDWIVWTDISYGFARWRPTNPLEGMNPFSHTQPKPVKLTEEQYMERFKLKADARHRLRLKLFEDQVIRVAIIWGTGLLAIVGVILTLWLLRTLLTLVLG